MEWEKKHQCCLAVYSQSKHTFVVRVFFSWNLQKILLSSLAFYIRHTEAMFRVVDLEVFPTLSVWACPRLTLSHAAAKLKQQTKPSALPCTHVSQQWAETQISTSSFLLSPQVLLIDGRDTWLWGQMGARPYNSWSAWSWWSGGQGTHSHIKCSALGTQLIKLGAAKK